MRLQLQMSTVASLTKGEGPSAHVWAKMIAPLIEVVDYHEVAGRKGSVSFHGQR